MHNLLFAGYTQSYVASHAHTKYRHTHSKVVNSSRVCVAWYWRMYVVCMCVSPIEGTGANDEVIAWLHRQFKYNLQNEYQWLLRVSVYYKILYKQYMFGLYIMMVESLKFRYPNAFFYFTVNNSRLNDWERGEQILLSNLFPHVTHGKCHYTLNIYMINNTQLVLFSKLLFSWTN